MSRLRAPPAEFVASEALHYLGVPTTRALSLVGTGAEVVRDMFYKCAHAQDPAPSRAPWPCRTRCGLPPKRSQPQCHVLCCSCWQALPMLSSACMAPGVRAAVQVRSRSANS